MQKDSADRVQIIAKLLYFFYTITSILMQPSALLFRRKRGLLKNFSNRKIAQTMRSMALS